MRHRSVIVLAVAGLLTTGGCSGTAPDLPASSDAVTPSAQVTDRPTPSPTSTSSVRPRVSGEFAGDLAVTADTNRMSSYSVETEDLTGTRFTRTVTFGDDCDEGLGSCSMVSEPLWVYEATGDLLWEPVLGVGPVEDGRMTATLAEVYEDDCVAMDGTTIGSFHTTATTVITFSTPTGSPESPAWSEAHLSYTEESVGGAGEEGCSSSTFAVEGALLRR